MLPENNTMILSDEIQIKTIPTKTYQLRLDKKEVQGFVDHLEAMKQAIYKLIFTERYRHEIYNWNYGIELSDLMGRAKSYVIPELKKRIEEALLTDDRIISVTEFQFFEDKNSLTVQFQVETCFGSVEIEREVMV